MKNDPSLVKIALPFGRGDMWIQATPTCLAFLDFRADPDGTECLRIKTGTNYEKRRAIAALRSVAAFLESKLDAAEVPPCENLRSPPVHQGKRQFVVVRLMPRARGGISAAISRGSRGAQDNTAVSQGACPLTAKPQERWAESLGPTTYRELID